MIKPIKLIILDRDGVINQDRDDFVKHPDEWVAIPGSLETIAKLNQLTIPVVVATNQSGIARGYFAKPMLELIHQKMKKSLAEYRGHLARIYICPHGPDDHCSCRKPKPGMYLQAIKEFKVDAANVLVVGDSLRDIEAAQQAGCQTILVRTGKGAATLAKHPELSESILIMDDLQSILSLFSA